MGVEVPKGRTWVWDRSIDSRRNREVVQQNSGGNGLFAAGNSLIGLGDTNSNTDHNSNDDD